MANRDRALDAAEDAYRSMHLGGYSVAMSVEFRETIFSPTALLWLVVVGTAAILLFGSMNRRRSRLTDSLRDYVDRSQEGRQATSEGREDALDD